MTQAEKKALEEQVAANKAAEQAAADKLAAEEQKRQQKSEELKQLEIDQNNQANPRDLTVNAKSGTSETQPLVVETEEEETEEEETFKKYTVKVNFRDAITKKSYEPGDKIEISSKAKERVQTLQDKGII